MILLEQLKPKCGLIPAEPRYRIRTVQCRCFRGLFSTFAALGTFHMSLALAQEFVLAVFELVCVPLAALLIGMLRDARHTTLDFFYHRYVVTF